MNRLLFGDNLNWLRNREIFPDASVDLVYLDPPFNSNADCLAEYFLKIFKRGVLREIALRFILQMYVKFTIEVAVVTHNAYGL